MTPVVVLGADDVSALLDPVELRRMLERAMIAMSAGATDVPPRIGARSPAGLVGAMPGYVEDVALGSKVVSVFPANRTRGLPSHQGVMLLFDEETGAPLAVMDAQVITAARTSMSAAIAADLLARPDAEDLTIVGAGAQARAHVDALAPIRPWRRVRIANRTDQRARELAGYAEPVFHCDTLVVADTDAAVDGADVVALCTDADAPVFDAARLDRGAHVSSVGSGAELPAAVVGSGRLVIEWQGAITAPPPAGAAELQHLGPDDAVELGELLAGKAVGRTSSDQLTVYKSTGHAAQDLAAARVVYDAAIASGSGTTLTL